MPVQTIPFQLIEDIIDRLENLGCEIKTLPEPMIGPDGERIVVRFAYNPKTDAWYHLNFEDGEYVTGSVMEGIERTLSVDLGFPKLPPYRSTLSSSAKH